MKPKYLLIAVATMSLGFNQGIRADAKNIQCWGNNAAEQLNVPDGILPHKLDGELRDVHFGRGYTCILTSKAKVDCWGARTADSEFLMSLEQVKSFAIGVSEFEDESFACASTGSKVLCSGMDSPTQEYSPDVVLAVGGNDFACALDKAEVSCWGGRSLDLPAFKNPRKLIAGSDVICVLDDSGVNCIEDGRSDLRINQVPKLTEPSDIYMTIGYACAKEKEGLKCWGRPDEDGLPDIPTLPATKSETTFVSGEFHICGLSQNQVQCWGDNTFKQLDVPKLSNPKQIFSNYSGSQVCAIDDTGLVCWGADSAGQASLLAFDGISAGFGNTCIIVNGKSNCWGKASQSINDGSKAPRDLGKNGLYQIGLGSNFACGLNTRSGDLISCWGSNATVIKEASNNGLSEPFEKLPNISVGFAHVCYSTDSVRCFGANEYGQSTPPNNIRTNIEKGIISSGGHHSCAIDSKLGVRCWGQNKFGQSEPPNNLKNPKSISSGFAHTCVLDAEGVKCWGRNLEGQTLVPPLKNPKTVQAGGYHTCAIDDDGVKCWGDNSFGQTEVPKSLSSHILFLTTGYLHSCAVVK